MAFKTFATKIFPLALPSASERARSGPKIDEAESRKGFEKFTGLWKDAAADVVVRRQARLEYAHFQ